MSRFRTLIAVLAAAAWACAAPTLKHRDVVPGKYIITLKPGVQLEQHISWASAVHTQSPKRRAVDTGVSHQYSIQDFSAYAGAFDEATIEQIRNSEDVSSTPAF